MINADPSNPLKFEEDRAGLPQQDIFLIRFLPSVSALLPLVCPGVGGVLGAGKSRSTDAWGAGFRL